MEVGFQHGTDNRAGRRGPETALFRQDGDDDARMFIRRIGDEPAMVRAAEVFRRPCLTSDLDGEAGEQGTSCTGFFSNVTHPFADQVQRRFGYGQGADLFRCKNLIRRAVEVVDTADDERPVLDAAVSDFADDHGCLERRNQLEPLTDSRVERIAEVPS